MTVYIISAILVLIFSSLMAMAGLGAAFLFVPLCYYLGVPLAEATPTALLLNVVSLFFATVCHWRGGLINWRVGLPILAVAVIAAPLGARLTSAVDQRLLLGLFAAFLVFAGSAFATHLVDAQFDWLLLGLTSVAAVIGAQAGAAFMARRVKA